jgi:hypothetical protein
MATPPRMKMSTEVPEGVATPNLMETRIGTLSLQDGIPDEDTVRNVYDNLDFQRGVQAFLHGIQIASMSAMRKGMLEFGPSNETVLIFETLMDSKALWLTPNTTNIYMATWLELSDEPMVIETPPDVLGLIDDHWFKWVGDFGRLGPDQSQGGKFLILPPGYDGEVPDGFFVYPTNTYGNWVIWRGFQVEGNTTPAVQTTKQTFRMYPLSQKDHPPEMTFVNVSERFNSTVHRMDYGIFEEINEVIQAEPASGQNEEILGILAAIGIKKGRPFEPDKRMQGILAEAAEVGSATVRTIMSKPRDDIFYFYPGESVWCNPFPGGSYEWLDDGATLLDVRAGFFFYATGNTPAMAREIIGKGSKYAFAYMDSGERPFEGDKTYKVHLPPDVPAKDFWSFTLYDNQTRAMLQTDFRFPGIDSKKPDLAKNDDGSYEVYFGPEPPTGHETNWVQTVPGKGWNMIFRLYGPLEPWFDKEWRPGEPEFQR